MRFEHHTILELALVVRDSKANPNAYDREARETLRRACRIAIAESPLEQFLAKYPHPTDGTLARQAWNEVQAHAKPAGYTSGVWTA
jgi:hypothetical protein